MFYFLVLLAHAILGAAEPAPPRITDARAAVAALSAIIHRAPRRAADFADPKRRLKADHRQELYLHLGAYGNGLLSTWSGAREASLVRQIEASGRVMFASLAETIGDNVINHLARELRTLYPLIESAIEAENAPRGPGTERVKGHLLFHRAMIDLARGFVWLEEDRTDDPAAVARYLNQAQRLFSTLLRDAPPEHAGTHLAIMNGVATLLQTLKLSRWKDREEAAEMTMLLKSTIVQNQRLFCELTFEGEWSYAGHEITPAKPAPEWIPR